MQTTFLPKTKINQIMQEVSLEKNDETFVAIFMSPEEYEAVKENFEDSLWAQKALEQSEDGFLSAEESQNFLKACL